MSLRAIKLAAAFNLILLVDQTPAARGKRKPQYLTDDMTPKAQIATMRGPAGHWVVHRSIKQPRLVPKGGV